MCFYALNDLAKVLAILLGVFKLSNLQLFTLVSKEKAVIVALRSGLLVFTGREIENVQWEF